jgi:UDP-N-acetylglucosamine:LPS N-acetylglucosamine transferase
MAIVDELARLRDDFELRFVSYGAGALALAAHQRPLIDLDMPDANPLWTTVLRAGQLIRQMQPNLVVSHEEFAVLPVAKIFGLPAIFITEWFSDPDHLAMQSLAYADEVIVIEESGIFDEPPCVEGKVSYVGPVLRSFSYSKADRNRARGELGFDQEATIILVMPGGWATEEREPIYDTVMPVFDALKIPRKLLVWIAGADYELLTRRLAKRADVIVKERDWQIDRLMVASDLAITKGKRGTLRELYSLGIPSISISHGLNPFDDVLIERFHTNTALDARTLTHKMLATSILEALRDGVGTRASKERSSAQPNSNGAVLAAQRLADAIAALGRNSG